MGINFSLFRTPNHRVFNYQPLFYDQRKEELQEKIENARKKERGEYVPGSSIRGSFRRERYSVKKTDGVYSTTRRIITLLTLVVLMLAAVYAAKYMGLFF